MVRRNSRPICVSFSEYADIVLADRDVRVVSGNAASAKAPQWDILNAVKEQVPLATVVLRHHTLAWTRRADAPVLVLAGLLVTSRLGPLTFRREYAMP
jgi:hypothetical protein